MKQTAYSLLVIGLMCVARAELTVTLKPETTSPFLYEPFTLLLEAEREIQPPELPAGQGFTVTGLTPLKPGSFRLELIPEQSGPLTLPPISVTDGKESNQTAPLRITVSAPRRADEMTLSATVSATRLYTDQPVKLTLTWSNSVSFKQCEELLFDIPLLRRPSWEVYPLDPGVPENERIGLPVNQQRVIARLAGQELSFSYILIPRQAEQTPLEQARISCALLPKPRITGQYPSFFDNHFFNRPEKSDRFERIWLTAPLPELTVLALPETGRTARYCGIVGTSATVSASVHPEQTVVGQPMLLTVELHQLDSGTRLDVLPEAVLNDLGSEFQLTPRPLDQSRTETSQTFTYVLRPLRSGIPHIPAFALQIFDPEEQTYRIIRTAPLNIQIDPDGEQTVYQPHLSGDRKPKIPLSGIRGNQKESPLPMNIIRFFEFLARHIIWIWLLPPLLWLALCPWLRRRDRCRTDPVYARALYAARRFRRSIKQDEETAWKSYLADRFNLTAEAVTFEAVLPELEKHNLSPELIADIRARFVQQDTTHYAPAGTAPRKAPAARELVAQLEKAARIILLLFFLLPAFDSDAAAPDDLFRQAMQIRAEKPDEAAPLFTEAALGFEAEGRFLNAGNSWFFAGQNGRALVNYRAAERRNPFDRQTRESIAFSRAQQPDRFQIPDTLLSGVSKVWKPFCRWVPSIRLGLLTLLYLTGWTLLLAARISGRKIPLRVWTAFGVIALIPVLSLLYSAFQPPEGVVVQSAQARLGPGYAYDPAYETLLNEAAEFQWLEARDGWIRARLPDAAEVWLPESTCLPIR